MKVIQISTFPNKAAGSIMMNLHKEMRTLGIESYVAWGRGRDSNDETEYYMDDVWGVRFHGIYTRILDKTGFASKTSTKKLIDWMDKINPDIVHLHCIHGYYLHIGLLFEYLKKKNIKVVWTQHDCWAFTGHCAYFDSVGCDKWKNGCNNCPQLHSFPASYVVDNSKSNWNKKKSLFNLDNLYIVTPCEWLKNIVSESFLSNHTITVIYNGIDDHKFCRRKSDFIKENGLENKKIILGVASEWTERKGLNDFINLDKLIDHDVYKIVVVGVNDVQRRDIPESIIAINRTNNLDELISIYSCSYLFFNPTYEDNFPTTNLEAISCGLPVVTYETGGSPESINGSGFVLPKGDLEGFINILPSVEKLGRIKLDDRFKKKFMISNYIKLYKQLSGEEYE